MQTGQVVIGIDPGVKGYLGKMVVDCGQITTHPMADIYDAVQYIIKGDFVVAEKVQPRPSQNLKGVVTSCVNYGRLHASLYWRGIDVVWVRPQEWQKEMGLQRRWVRPKSMTDEQYATWKYAERKRWHKKAAKELCKTSARITLDNADALLITEYARKLWKQKNY